MAIAKEDWLHHAKRLPMGRTNRVQHGRESRQNLIVGNDSDRWWCYCQSCKAGSVEMKEHVRITGKPAPKDSESLTLPSDMERVLTAEKAVQDAVLGFLAVKNMDAAYMPELWFSKSRCRLMLQWQGEWLGRDTTGRSPQKWLTFQKSNHLSPVLTWCGTAVIVEDPLSFMKVRWATKDIACDVFCSLGTATSDELFVKLLKYNRVLYYYDGDKAGHKGADREAHRMRASGIKSAAACAPDGSDPKDQSILAIQMHITSNGPP